jgi:hypothetical protein
MPIFAHFCFVISMNFCFHVKLMWSVSVGTLLVELTNACCNPISTQFCFVVNSEVFNILHHFFPRAKLHLLLCSLIEHKRPLFLLKKS